jgi:hypothetical protein
VIIYKKEVSSIHGLQDASGGIYINSQYSQAAANVVSVVFHEMAHLKLLRSSEKFFQKTPETKVESGYQLEKEVFGCSNFEKIATEFEVNFTEILDDIQDGDKVFKKSDFDKKLTKFFDEIDSQDQEKMKRKAEKYGKNIIDIAEFEVIRKKRKSTDINISSSLFPKESI